MPNNTPPLGGPATTAQSSRGFTVRDLMILVAATAVGVLGFKANDAAMTERGYALFRVVNVGGWEVRFGGLEILFGPGLTAMTAGLVLVRLLPPWPPRLPLFRQPGFVALGVALVLTAWCFLKGLFFNWLIVYDDWALADEWEAAIREASAAILVAWSVLALAGCSRAERGWVDRTSRAVAALWVAAGIASGLSGYWLYV